MRKIYIILFQILNNFDFRYRHRTISNYLDKFRMFCLKKCGAKIGKNSRIGCNAFILNFENLSLGDNSSIEKNCEIFNYDLFSVGDNVEIGTQLYVNTSNHRVENNNLPLAKQGALNKKITIESDVWIGARVTILSGAYISKRVVLGAGSIVVSKLLNSNKIYAGNPAKEIKDL